MHYIYHIPERNKIGCTINLSRRMYEHNWDGHYDILEVHLSAKEAGIREKELQREYGYPVDSKSYDQVLEMGKIGFANVKYENRICHDSDHQKKASAGGHLAKLRKGTYDIIGRKKRKLTFEDAEQIRQYSNEGMKQRDIAKIYDVSQRTINMIINRITYKKP